jgi:hypothetical protein
MNLNKKQDGDATELLLRRDAHIHKEFDKWEKNQNMLFKEIGKYGYVYVIKCANAYKIGITRFPKNRVKTYKTENPFKIKVIIMEMVENYKELETYIHDICHHRNLHGEWFTLNKEELRIVLIDIKSKKNYNEN